MNIVDTIRVQFSKTDQAKYISHLDLVRTMTRVVRRAKIPLWYTEGFSKHPYITFAAPLSLGYNGLCEYMDFRLEEPMEMEEIVQRLNDSMPVGLRVLEAAPAVHKVAQIVASKWLLEFSSEHKSVIESGLSNETLVVQKRTKKGKMKEIDIKPLIKDVSLFERDSSCVLEVVLPTGEGAVNPSLLMDALFGDNHPECTITRVSVLMNNNEKFC